MVNGKINSQEIQEEKRKRQMAILKASNELLRQAKETALKRNSDPIKRANLEKEFGKHCILNLFAHTHQETNFYNGLPFCYHVGLDSHNCTPITIEQALDDIKTEVANCELYIKGE